MLNSVYKSHMHTDVTQHVYIQILHTKLQISIFNWELRISCSLKGKNANQD